MRIFHIFFNSVIGELCCFEGWTGWKPSSLTCGRVCSHRERDILEGWDAFAAETCNWDHSTCPWSEVEEACQTIDCRK